MADEVLVIGSVGSVQAQMDDRSLCFSTSSPGTSRHVPIVTRRDRQRPLKLGVVTPARVEYHSPNGEIHTLGKSRCRRDNRQATVTYVRLNCLPKGVR